MGIVVPRPAMRAREERMIRARLAFYTKRSHELEAHGMLANQASGQAYIEAKQLKFTRDGRVKER